MIPKLLLLCANFLLLLSVQGQSQPDTIYVKTSAKDPFYVGNTFFCYKRYTGVADPATKRGKMLVDSSIYATTYVKIDSGHVYLGDSSYRILTVYKVTPFDLALETVKDRGKTAIDTAALDAYFPDSVAHWRFDIDPIKGSNGLYHIMVSGHRWKHWNGDKAYHGFGLYYFEAKPITPTRESTSLLQAELLDDFFMNCCGLPGLPEHDGQYPL